MEKLVQILKRGKTIFILEEEEQNIVSELQNDDELSFDGSIHEEGSDPVEDAENKFLQNEYNQENGYDEEDD